ncbi:MAG: 3-oxoacyl-[acyl-carrier-protein] synthase III C-terminal domain-containing protein [Bacillota bacterium]|nr:3-oxoacyl-[acyl-carrier-protein] synthase III C-terminal domain-containing protein [Bacillota bacterium]
MIQDKFFFPKWKRKSINRYCKIYSIASYVPEKSISNEEIISKYNLAFKSPVIIKSVGVESRHIADNSLKDSDVLYLSSKECLERYDFVPDNLSRIFVNKYMGDNILPMTASKLKVKLGNKKAIQAFDIDGGISSFLISFDLISRYINSGDDYILLASGGITNRMISKTDPRVAFLFGDASASILFGHSENQHILASYFYSNYQFYELSTAISPLTLVEMGVKSFKNGEGSILFDTYKMENWKLAENFYKEATRVISNNLLEESGLTLKDIDMVLVTENNRKIWEMTLDTLGFSEDKSISLLRKHGNTMSAMLPLQMDFGFRTGRILPGMNIMLISHGEGLSGGGIIYKV